MGLLKVGTISLDGTKIKANASKHKALSYGYTIKIEKQLQEEVKLLMDKASQADNSNENDGMSIPDEISRRVNRLSAIKEVKERIEAREKLRYEKEKETFDTKAKKRKLQSKLTGKKPRGKVPVEPDKEVNPKAQVNLTD